MDQEDFDALTRDEKIEEIRRQYDEMVMQWPGDSSNERLARSVIGASRLVDDVLAGCDEEDRPNPLIFGVYQKTAAELKEAVSMIMTMQPVMKILDDTIRNMFDTDDGEV